MTDTDGYFLPRPEQQQLRELLAQIPGLAEDLAIAVTRQDRIGRGGGGKRGRLDASPLPVNLAAMDARDELHACLAGWARLTCEQRQLDYTGQDTLIGVARWLTRWLIAVALTEGADEIIGDLTAAIRRCRRVIDLPVDRETVLLGLCPGCGARVSASNGDAEAQCPRCGETLTIEQTRATIDHGMHGLAVTANQAAELVNLRYKTTIKPKAIYDLAYRKNDPIPVDRQRGQVTFWMRLVVDELRKQGKLA